MIGWTKEHPTQPGYYFASNGLTSTVQYVVVDLDENKLVAMRVKDNGDCQHIALDEWKYWWPMPILEPPIVSRSCVDMMERERQWL